MYRNFMAAMTAVAALVMPMAHAQTETAYPNKPIKLIIPYPAGGSGDTTARFLANALNQKWGVPLVVENRPGGSAIIGTQAVANAASDGYTVLFTTTLHIQNSAVGRTLPYDPLKDFVPITQVLCAPAALVIGSDNPAKTVNAFVNANKAGARATSFGSAGNATTSHLYGELFNRLAGLKAVHVPYKGGAPMMTDLLGGQLDYALIDAGSVMPMAKAGRVKVLAVASSTRYELMPETPTLKELGYEGFESCGWMGVLMRAGTPQPIVAKWAKELTEITQSAGYRSMVQGLGMEPTSISQDDFGQLMRRDIANWKRIADLAGIKVE
ncbi:Bug family tripartite tricarboxylate transporter substrate binding protein [Acidovorax sp. SDU_ACID1]|uniref:Bug family tripartite tricarboxylate transporter substrate binding protein n=1 Tax=Acidovorax sp. SDU_ACID1 TaxID=3136632 RepID=UPI0038739D8C